jgi:hypothetical protein
LLIDMERRTKQTDNGKNEMHFKKIQKKKGSKRSTGQTV